MKIKHFNQRTVEFQTRFLASHLPSGRVWNTKTGRNLWKMVNILASGSFEIYKLISLMIYDFKIETSTTFLKYWEESLGIPVNEALPIADRRNNVKAQYRKRSVVTKEEWEDVIGTAVGRAVSVYPAKEIDMTDTFFLFPYEFPIYFYPPNPSDLKQNRFIVIVDGVTVAERAGIELIVKKFRPSNVYTIYIDRT